MEAVGRAIGRTANGQAGERSQLTLSTGIENREEVGTWRPISCFKRKMHLPAIYVVLYIINNNYKLFYLII